MGRLMERGATGKDGAVPTTPGAGVAVGAGGKELLVVSV